SHRLHAGTAPIFSAVWVLLGLFVLDFFTPIPNLRHAFSVLLDRPLFFALCAAKGFFLLILFRDGQILRKENLSSYTFGTPFVVIGSMLINAMLGEHLTLPQIISAFGVLTMAILFFTKGNGKHLSKPFLRR